MTLALCLATTFGLSSTQVLAQERTYEVNSEDLSAEFIEPYPASFTYTVTNADGEQTVAGQWTDKVDHVDLGGIRLLRRSVERIPAGQQSDLVRIMLADPNTLSPARTDQRFGPGLLYRFHVDFTSDAANQIILGPAEGPAQISNLALEKPVFDPSFWATLAMIIPFEKGLEANLPVYRAQPASVGTETFHVIGEEDVEAMGQTFRAWKIEASSANWTFWLRKQKPYIVRIDHPLETGEMAISLPDSFE